MRKLTISMTVSLVICIMLSVISNASAVQSVTDKIIRVHVIANSDSDYDQQIKLNVRDSVLAACNELLADLSDKQTALVTLSSNLSLLEDVANETLSLLETDCVASCTLEKTVFPDKSYDDITLPAGVYDALCIRIGEGRGKNFWCICYPSLCIGACSSLDEFFTDDEQIIIKSPEKIRYKLFCFKLVGKIKALFL